jgi:DNA replication protein DnaD
MKMKAIVKKQKDDGITLKIIPDTDTEKRFLKVLLKYDGFSIKTKDSINFIINFVKCDNCKFNEFYETVEGIKNGNKHKFDLGKCICPEKEYYKKIGLHCLENEFSDCNDYIPIKLK